MSTALIFLILLSPFALAALLSWAAHRFGALQQQLELFRLYAPMAGRLFDDRDSYREHHDLDAIRTRFEEQPVWPTSSASGERR